MIVEVLDVSCRRASLLRIPIGRECKCWRRRYPDYPSLLILGPLFSLCRCRWIGLLIPLLAAWCCCSWCKFCHISVSVGSPWFLYEMDRIKGLNSRQMFPEHDYQCSADFLKRCCLVNTLFHHWSWIQGRVVQMSSRSQKGNLLLSCDSILGQWRDRSHLNHFPVPSRKLVYDSVHCPRQLLQ